jgi:hypothetical protein
MYLPVKNIHTLPKKSVKSIDIQNIRTKYQLTHDVCFQDWLILTI